MPTQTKQLGRIWASSPESITRDPGVDKYSLGFIAEIPTYQVLNYLHQRIDINILALAERGVFAWGGDVDYLLNAKVWDDLDGKVYQAKVASPDKLLAPSLNPTQWDVSLIQLTQAEFDAMEAALNSHVTNFANPHKLTAAQLDTYTRAQINALITTLQTNLDDHEQDFNNPHEDTAASIGAVPITGGVYSGPVTHATGEVIIGAAGALTSVKVSAGRVFLKSDTYEMGIDASGNPYVTNADGTSLLLDEDLFLSTKATEEKNYATPLPATECKFSTDINMYAGIGPVKFSSPGGKSFVARDGVTKTSAVDEPRYTQYGMAFRDATEVLELDRTYEGKGWSAMTTAIEFYIGNITGDGQNIMIDTGYLGTRLLLNGSTLTLSYVNATNVTSTINLGNISTGRHTFAVSVSATGSIVVYLDGVKKNTEVITLPVKTTWTGTKFMNKTSGTLTSDNYMVRFRAWPFVLTDKQVVGL